jgi:hypothetical protein
MAAPIPPPGHYFIGLGLMYGWGRLRLTEGARLTDDKLKTAFNEQAMMERYKDFIVANPERPEELRIKDTDLLWHSTKKSCDDSWETVKHAWTGFRGYIGWNPKP